MSSSHCVVQAGRGVGGGAEHGAGDQGQVRAARGHTRAGQVGPRQDTHRPVLLILLRPARGSHYGMNSKTLHFFNLLKYLQTVFTFTLTNKTKRQMV